jgi:peptide/nickel transport system substrate-binding protein
MKGFNMDRVFNTRLGRRALVGAGGVLGMSLAGVKLAGAQGTPVVSPSASPDLTNVPVELVVDLDGPPDNLDPALSYSVRDWSIVHSIYDAIIQFDEDGTLVPLAAEEFSTDDAVTFRIRLREGMTFHDGTPVTSAAITRAVDHLQASDSQITDLFSGITEVREIDELNAEIITGEPSAWLPSQMAVWLVLIPESATPESLGSNPVGSGPYVFESHDPGNSVSLVRNDAYTWGSPKGTALAERVTFRFVPESATRVADLTTGTAQIVSEIPVDQLQAIEEAGHTVITTPIPGTTFIRTATDVAPFDDVRVRQALNYGVDVQTIADTIVGPNATRLASFFPDPRALGYDESLEPFPYDPDRARTLLAEADLADGFDAEIEVVASSRIDVVEAIVAQLEEVGIRLKMVTTDLAAFNQGWPKSDAPALRYASWRPMYDPHTFLSLVIDSEGFLSRFENVKADELIAAATIEPDPNVREEIYQQLGALLKEEPAGIYLWNATANYGVTDEFLNWTPRGDQYIVPTDMPGDN